MHTIRLLQSCEQIFRTGSLQVRVDNRDELLDIKSGKWPYDMIMQKQKTLFGLSRIITPLLLFRNIQRYKGQKVYW